MSRTIEAAPNPLPVLAGLKDFQRRTVEYAFRRLYTDPDSTHRFLVADEVGLGKTLVARGVIAKAVEHLWDKVDRIDVVYVCSNADIARQNIDRLRLDMKHDFARATRATMLPLELKDMDTRRVNFVSMTPGTSLEPRGGTGVVAERALLFRMLREHWGLHEGRSSNVLRCGVGYDKFHEWIKWIQSLPLDRVLQAKFLSELDALEIKDRSAKKPTLRARMEKLCELLPRRDSSLDEAGLADRRALVADLRTTLGRTCITALRPDLVILDEFQRFKHLLDPTSEDAELARTLFEYADEREGASEAVRVLLLSATPYKMYTLQHEQESGENDHYEDFIATYEFLTRHSKADSEALRGLLKSYRAAMLRLDGDGLAELRRLKGELEARLRKGMSRTERLTVTQDRSGMLREQPNAIRFEATDVRQYLSASRVAAALDHGEIVEYWKSAPYLLNFMDDYQLKRDLREASGKGAADPLVDALGRPDAGLLAWEDVQSYKRIDPANGRLRALLDDTVGKDLWKLLWLPPSLPYYPLGGAYKGVSPLATTKRLVFSSWQVVPKVIAAVLSHEAERHAMRLMHTGPDGEVTVVNSTEGRKKVTALLRFGLAEGRLTGMPVLGLMYPSFTLAGLLDPAEGASTPVLLEDLLKRASDALVPLLEDLYRRWAPALARAASSPIGTVDETWYWATPILLDLARSPEHARAYWDQRMLSDEWTDEGDRGDADSPPDTESVWSQHVDRARDLVLNAAIGKALSLGPPPADLAEVLAMAAIGNPAILALRSLSRVTGGGSREVPVRLAAARVAWRIRNLFNLPEVNSIVRGLGRPGADPDAPYWRRVMEYAADGCLQSVLDEYAHVLRESLGVAGHTPADAAAQIGAEMARAIGIRSASVGVDQIEVSRRSSKVTVTTQRMRARFAARFGQEQHEGGKEVTRADQVRSAFNSPFWPFVLASTSVGQEGLDFHHYCHAIVHWNLPSNPVDLEQREGRIHRFKGHAVRKNVALKHGAQPAPAFSDRWDQAFSLAVAAQPPGGSELAPYWVFTFEGGAAIERYVPTLPLSRDAERLVNLRSSLAVYRMVFGQPRQDELVEHLLTRYPRELVDRAVDDLRMNLDPPLHNFEGTPASPTPSLSGSPELAPSLAVSSADTADCDLWEIAVEAIHAHPLVTALCSLKDRRWGSRQEPGRSRCRPSGGAVE